MLTGVVYVEMFTLVTQSSPTTLTHAVYIRVGKSGNVDLVGP